MNLAEAGPALKQKLLEALNIGVYHRQNVIPEGMKPHPSMLKLAADEELVRATDNQGARATYYCPSCQR